MYLHSSTLRYLLKVGELGSIRRASEELNVASSAVNRKILKLERDLGVDLFKRSVKGMTPTSAGLLLMRHTRETLIDYQRTVDEIVCRSGELRGQVRIIGIGSIIELIMPDLIVGLAKQHKGIRFHIVDATPDEVFEGLASGNFDIGITFLDRRQSNFELCARLDTSVGALMKADHPLANRQTVTLTECSSHETSMFSDRWVIRPLVDSEFQRTGAEFKPRMITNSMVVMQAAIRQGLGIGFFTPIGFIDDIRKGETVHVPLRQSELATAGIGLFAEKAMMASPHVDIMLKSISNMFGELQVTLDSL